MKANELRVGNFFNPINRSAEIHLPMNGIILRVITIKLFRVEACLINENPAQIAELPEVEMFDMSPIPLTEDWLFRMGFEKQGDKFVVEEPINLEVDLDNNYHYLSDTHGCSIAPHVKHVHELQNLYFALTGEELIVMELTSSE